MNLWESELVKSFFSCLSGGVVLSLGWLFGQRITVNWNVKQKRRELQLIALQQFYVAYGEFFAVWKIWNRLDPSDRESGDKRWELHKRAAAAEAIVEGICVRLASESQLMPSEINDLGCFRQGFQGLRRAIQDSDQLRWFSSENPEYLRFKALSVRTALLLSGDGGKDLKAADMAANRLMLITSNDYEWRWAILPEKAGQSKLTAVPQADKE